ncbi:MAG: nitrilase-related carbon-nitrogen hydrolase [Gammaproteobacteria bacterium]
MKNSKTSSLNKIDIVIIQKKINNDSIINLQEFSILIKKIKVVRQTIVVLHELSFLNYFCIEKDLNNKKLSIKINSPIINEMKKLCIEKNIFLVFPFYERTVKNYYNTAIVISPVGKIIGKYHKKYLPNEPCYHEKYYFSESSKPNFVIDIGVCKIGIMICWDQWHSEPYSQLNKLGADLILCPTSIGKTYINKKLISLPNEKLKWKMVIQANSLMNNIPVVVANRIGSESKKNRRINFWGSSFVTNADGDIITEALDKAKVIKSTIDLNYRRRAIQKWLFKKSP